MWGELAVRGEPCRTSFHRGKRGENTHDNNWIAVPPYAVSPSQDGIDRGMATHLHALHASANQAQWVPSSGQRSNRVYFQQPDSKFLSLHSVLATQHLRTWR